MILSDTLSFPAIFLLAGFFLGYLVHAVLHRSYKKRLNELEQEMLNNHAEILSLHEDKVQLQQKLNESRIPVITMHTSKDKGPEEPLAKQAN